VARKPTFHGTGGIQQVEQYSPTFHHNALTFKKFRTGSSNEHYFGYRDTPRPCSRHETDINNERPDTLFIPGNCYLVNTLVDTRTARQSRPLLPSR